MGAVFYRYNDTAKRFEKVTIASATQLAHYASDSAEDIYVKQDVNGKAIFVRAKLKATDQGFFDDYYYTVEGDVDENSKLVEYELAKDLNFFERVETQVPNPDYIPPTTGATTRATARGDISPFQACCTALASTLGVGNIAGVSVAIATGGPGAVFWMWAVASWASS